MWQWLVIEQRDDATLTSPRRYVDFGSEHSSEMDAVKWFGEQQLQGGATYALASPPITTQVIVRPVGLDAMRARLVDNDPCALHRDIAPAKNEVVRLPEITVAPEYRARVEAETAAPERTVAQIVDGKVVALFSPDDPELALLPPDTLHVVNVYEEGKRISLAGINLTTPFVVRHKSEGSSQLFDPFAETGKSYARENVRQPDGSIVETRPDCPACDAAYSGGRTIGHVCPSLEVANIDPASAAILATLDPETSVRVYDHPTPMSVLPPEKPPVMSGLHIWERVREALICTDRGMRITTIAEKIGLNADRVAQEIAVREHLIYRMQAGYIWLVERELRPYMVSRLSNNSKRRYEANKVIDVKPVEPPVQMVLTGTSVAERAVATAIAAASGGTVKTDIKCPTALRDALVEAYPGSVHRDAITSLGYTGDEFHKATNNAVMRGQAERVAPSTYRALPDLLRKYGREPTPPGQ